MKILRIVVLVLLLSAVSCTFGQNTVETVEEEVSAAVIADIQPTTKIPATSTIPPTSTEEPATETPIPPTEQIPPTETDTPVPPTETDTPVPPTETDTPVPPTETDTQVPPTPTPTDTPVPPTATAVPLVATEVLPVATAVPIPPTQEPEEPNVGGSLFGCPILYWGQYYSFSWGSDFMITVGSNNIVESISASGNSVIVVFEGGNSIDLANVKHIEAVRLFTALASEPNNGRIRWIDITKEDVLNNVKPGTHVFYGYSDPNYGDIFKLGIVCDD